MHDMASQDKDILYNAVEKEERQCTTCKFIKYKKEFRLRRRGARFILGSKCKDCENEESAQRRADYRTFKAIASTVLQDNKCNVCNHPDAAGLYLARDEYEDEPAVKESQNYVAKKMARTRERSKQDKTTQKLQIGQCADCGLKVDLALASHFEFDHIDRKDKKCNVSDLMGSLKAWPRNSGP
jgi:hypothetical protein